MANQVHNFLVRSRTWLVVSIILLIIGINFASISSYPPPTCDETSYGSTAISFLEKGEFGWATFSEGDYIGRNINLFRQGRIYTFGLAGLFAILGKTLWVGRLYSVFGWGLAGYLTYFLGRRLYNAHVGLFAALAFLTSTKAFLTSHIVRPDIWLLAINLLTLCLFLKLAAINHLVAPLTAGIFSLLPLDIHGHGAAFLPAFIFLYIYLELPLKNYQRLFVYFLGLVLGSIIWISLHLWPSITIAIYQMREAIGFTIFSSQNLPTSEVLIRNLTSLVKFFGDAYWVAGGLLGLAELGLGTFGLAFALIHRNSSDVIMATIIGVPFFFFTIIFSQRFSNYGILWSPLLYLVGFGAAERLTNHLTHIKKFSFLEVSIVLASSLVILLNLAGNFWLTYRYRENNFDKMNQTIQTIIPAGARVLGDQNWWWILRDVNAVIPDEYFLYPLPYENDPTLNAEGRVKDYIAYFHPNYILIDSSIACAMDAGGPGWTELDDFTKNECKVVGTIDGAWWGDLGKSTNIVGQRTTIYQCDTHS